MRVVHVSVPLTLGVDGMVKAAMIDFWARQKRGMVRHTLPSWMPPSELEPGWILWGEIGVADPDGAGLADTVILEGLFAEHRHRVADLLQGSTAAACRDIEALFDRLTRRLEALGAGKNGPKEVREVKTDSELGRCHLALIGPGGIPDLVNARLA